jgi:hypothetical protein
LFGSLQQQHKRGRSEAEEDITNTTTEEEEEEDVTMELNISTLSRIQKITQFNTVVLLSCESGLPVRLTSHLGETGSRIDVFVEQDNQSAATTTPTTAPPSSPPSSTFDYLCE